MRFFNYAPSKASKPLGTGTEALALLKPQTDPLYEPIPAYRGVRRQLHTLKPNIFHGQQEYAVSLAGNGNILQGQIALQALTDFEAVAARAAAERARAK